ncbi:efflux RND transporter periplasmic adaptor subunit [Bacteroidota bacterium]
MKRIQSYSIIFISAAFLLNACKKPMADVSTDIEVPVGVIEVSTSSIEEYINTTGTVYPMKEVILSSEMSGKYRLQTNPITGKPYAIGDRVQENAILILLEDEEYYNDLRLKSTEVNYEISKQEYEKQQSLYEKGGATLRELKDAEISLINTEYELESNKINLAKMTVKAPFTGVISDLPYFTEGTKVPTGTELIKIIDYSLLYLETNLPEKYYGNIENGFKVYITSYTNPEDTLIGQITQISPEIDPDARTFKSFVEVNNTEKILQPGMFVRADMVVNSSDNTIVISKDIIVSHNRREMVYVVDKGVANSRVITTGLENDEFVEVTTGLGVGESVVSKGFETLRNDSKVKIIR